MGGGRWGNVVKVVKDVEFMITSLLKLMPKNIKSTYITSKEVRFANIPGGSFSISFWCNCLKQNQ